MTRAFWPLARDPVTDLQREILEERILTIPKRFARWVSTHCPERLLPNKESAGVLDALDGWGKEPQPSAWTASSWTKWPNSPYWSSMPAIQRKPINHKSITKAHGNNHNTPSK